MPGAKKVTVDIVGSAKDYQKATDEAVASTTRLGGIFDGLNKRFGSINSSLKPITDKGGIGGMLLGGVGLGAGMALFDTVTGAIGKVTDALGGFLDAARQDEVSQSQLRASLQANIVGWDGNTDAIERVIGARENLGFTDDAQRAALATLVTQTGNVSDALKIEADAMDLARLRGIALEDATGALGKAYLGSSTALKKLGLDAGAGAKGLDALTGVEKKAAGQAAAFAKTSSGAAEVLDVKMGEIQEAIGRLIEGPADAFVGFLSGVADAILNPRGVSEAMAAMTDQIKAMDQATKTDASGVETYTARIEHFRQALSQAPRNMPADWLAAREWVQHLGPQFLALGKDAIGNWIDMAAAAQKAGLSFEDFRSQAFAVVNGTDKAITEMVSSWMLGGPAVGKAAGEMAADVDQAGRFIRVGMKRTATGVLETMQMAKDPWKKAASELAAWVKDPFEPDKFAHWMKRQAAKFDKEAAQALHDGKPAISHRAKEAAAAVRDPFTKQLVNLGVDVDAAIQHIIELRRMAPSLEKVGSVISGTWGTVHHQPGHNAGGTDNWRGGPTWVGERGPELVNLPAGSQVIPNHRISGGGITVVINGAVGDHVALRQVVMEAVKTGLRADPGFLARASRA